MILACMPVDQSKLPLIPEPAAIVITDLYTLKTCAAPNCGDVWVGPRQMASFNSNPGGYVIFCYQHAVTAMRMVEDFDPEKDVIQLGGGYPAEGRARIS